jgi:glycosyltransferase involved in cell wall biosynthesis
MSFMKTFSVFIANYNHGKYLRRCLDSVVLQTRQPDQLVIVDDGSTDDSVSIIREYEAKYSFIEVHILEKNKGAIFATRLALSYVRCEYIYGVAADDYVLPGWFKAAMEAAELYPQAGVIFGNVLIANEQTGKSTISSYRTAGEPYLLPKEIFWDFISKTNYCTYITSSCLYRRMAWESVGGFREKIDHYCDSFAANTIGIIYGACHVAHPAHVFVQYENSFSAKQMSDTQKMLDIAFEIERLLQTSPFCDRIDSSSALAWVKEMKRQAIDNPIWNGVMKKVMQREKCWDELKSKKRSKAYLGWWWTFSRLQGQLWKIEAKFLEVLRRYQWRRCLGTRSHE